MGNEGNAYLLECLLESLDLSGQSNAVKNSLSTTVKGGFLCSHFHDLFFRSVENGVIDFLPSVFFQVYPSDKNLTVVTDIFRFLKVPLID